MNPFEWFLAIGGPIIILIGMCFGKTSEEYEREGGDRARY